MHREAIDASDMKARNKGDISNESRVSLLAKGSTTKNSSINVGKGNRNNINFYTGRDMDNPNEEDFFKAIGLSRLSNRSQQPVTCSICNKQYKDVHEHIEHMKTVHKMKASYRCSTCGQIFSSKAAVEAHLTSHAATDNETRASVMSPISSSASSSFKEGDKPSSSGSSLLSNIQVTRSACDAENVLDLDLEEDEEGDEDDDLLKEIYTCACGKAYLLRMSFDAHQKVCPSKKQCGSSGMSGNDNPKTSSDVNSVVIGTGSLCIRSDMIRRIHADVAANCKACLRPMKSFINLFTHLNRRIACRKHYCHNLVPSQFEEDDVSFNSEPALKRARNSQEMQDKGNSSYSKSPESLLKHKPTASSSRMLNDHKQQDFSPSFNDLGPEDILIAPADELIRRAYLVRNRVQCPRCLKTFGGKTPAVAYNNHRRNKHCPATQATVPYLKAKFNSRNKDQPSPKASNEILPVNLSALHDLEGKLPDHVSQIKYYCKLCPNRDIKNRVSLGVHLTTYHGLPPVNISSNEAIALRCQTCAQTFNSKYFYNMHRYECDLTSPYIGIIEPDKSNEVDDLIFPKAMLPETEDDNLASIHLPAPPPAIMPPPIQSISPTPSSPQPQTSQSKPLPQSHSFSPVESESSSSSIANHPKVKPAFNNPPRGSAVSNAYFGNNYTCTQCQRKGFSGPNAVRIHQKYQCINRPLVPQSKSPYPTPLNKARGKSYSRPIPRDEYSPRMETSESRLASLLGGPNALNSQIKQEDPGLLMCDDCGRGPYNSQYYLLEHKRQFCQANKLDRNTSSPSNSSSSKSLELESISEQLSKPIRTHKSNHVGRSSSHEVSSPVDLVRPVPQIGQQSLSIDSHEDLTNGSSNKNKSGSHALYKRDLIAEHFKQLNSSDDEDESDDELITCPYCRSCQFEVAVDLANHIKNQCPYQFRCAKCEQTFLTKASLVEHKKACLENSSFFNPKSFIVCGHCNLKFTSKQKLFYHEQACHKIYNADISQSVEELIKRASTCAICGMRTKNYIVKAKHEVKCLETALRSFGIKCLRFDDVEENDSDSSILDSDSVDQSSLISIDDGGHPPNEETLEQALRNKFNITKELRVKITKLEDDIIYFHTAQLYCNDTVSSQMEPLKKVFELLLRRLIPDKDIYDEIVKNEPVDIAVIAILKMMGSEPVSDKKMDPVNSFKSNIQSFLKLSIKKETLDQANFKNSSVDDVIHNLLNFSTQFE